MNLSLKYINRHCFTASASLFSQHVCFSTVPRENKFQTSCLHTQHLPTKNILLLRYIIYHSHGQENKSDKIIFTYMWISAYPYHIFHSFVSMQKAVNNYCKWLSHLLNFCSCLSSHWQSRSPLQLSHRMPTVMTSLTALLRFNADQPSWAEWWHWSWAGHRPASDGTHVCDCGDVWIAG